MHSFWHAFDFKNIPEILRSHRAWIFWRRELLKGRALKVPYTAMGYRASVTNREHWSHLEILIQILRARPGFAEGLGYVLTGTDRVCAMDLDRAIEDSGALKPWAAPLVKQFADTWWEVSPSGGGLHGWCLAEIPHALKKEFPAAEGALEIYATQRYMTVTGQRWADTPVSLSEHQSDIQALLEHHRPPVEARASLAPVIPDGQRYPAMLSVAGTLARRGVCDSAIKACLSGMAQEQFASEKTPAELGGDLRKIMSSVARWRM